MRRALAGLALAACAVLAACGQQPAGDDAVDAAPDAPACDPSTPRPVAPTVFVGPTGLESRIAAIIDAATGSIDVQMYSFTSDNIANRLIAARNRGLAVRVLLDGSQVGSDSTRTQLTNGGVMAKFAPTAFPNAHAKYLITGRTTAYVLSGNFSQAGFVDQRNYGVIDGDPDDVAALSAIFAADWAGTAAPAACSRLVVSPGDARARVLAHIGGARATLDVQLYYLSDAAVRQAIVDAQNRGVAVRVILDDPADMSENTATANALKTAGVPVRVMSSLVVHAKLIIADGAALIGSHNMSITSLRDNREVGVIVREGTAASVAANQFTTDWNGSRVW